MTRWLTAARLATGQKTELTKLTKPTPKEVLSVKSVLSKEHPDAPDPDGVARSPEAIERVWSEATRRAVEYRKTQKPPTCAHCGQSDWTVSVTELTGRKLHVQCWKAE